MKSHYIIILVLFLATLIIYTLSFRGEGANWNYFILLADAFLHGRLFLLENPPWLNELINWQGKYYVVYPPMPAILLIPFVALFGTSFWQPILSILLGSLNVAFSYAVLIKLFSQKVAIWISLLFAFGTIHWYHAEVGSAWYFAHIVAIFFIWLALLELFTKQRLFLIGFLIGGAYLSRLPTILAAIFVLFYLHQQFIIKQDNEWVVKYKNIFLFGVGLGIMILINWSYNFLRFGTVEDISYQLLPVFNEPWYQYGLFSVQYIPNHLKEIFIALPTFQTSPPFVIPSINVLALWFTTPAFILIFFANFKKIINIALLVTTIFLALPSLMHGSNGFTQFGYRFSLDYLPFLLLLAASGMRGKVTIWAKSLIILSIIINLWGVVMISVLGIWTI